MENTKVKKNELKLDIQQKILEIPDEIKKKKNKDIESRLFEFANFIESTMILLYIEDLYEVCTTDIIQKSYKYDKTVVLPVFGSKKSNFTLLKVDNPDTDLVSSLDRDHLEPDPNVCKMIPVGNVDLAIIPGIAFDEKGGRIGFGVGYYDYLTSKLPITTRKIAIAYEEQIVKQVPMESSNKYVDIIVTDKRIIYKI